MVENDHPGRLAPEWRRLLLTGLVGIVALAIGLLGLRLATDGSGPSASGNPTAPANPKPTVTVTVTVTASPRPGGTGGGALSTTAATFVAALAGQVVGHIPDILAAAIAEKGRAEADLRKFLLDRVVGPFAEELSKEAGKRLADAAADYLTPDDKTATDSSGRLRVCVALAEQLQIQIASDMRAGRYGPVGDSADIDASSGQAADRLAGELCGKLVGAPSRGGKKPASGATGDVMKQIDPTIEKSADNVTPAPICASEAGSGPPDSYVVRRGDNLWRIAAQHLPSTASDSTVNQLLQKVYQANRLVVGDNSDLIYAGQRLGLSGKPTASSAECP